MKYLQYRMDAVSEKIRRMIRTTIANYRERWVNGKALP